MNIGWIGAGLMGEPMAQRLLSSGHDVAVHSRTRTSADSLVSNGANWSTSIADCTKGSDVVITMLPFPTDVAQVYESPHGLINAARPGTTLIDMTTSSPELAMRLARSGAEKDVEILDAPVSGGPEGAASGTLSIMIGGPETAFEVCTPLFNTLGSTVVRHGSAGSGQRVKLPNQMLIAGVMGGIAEAYHLAEALDLDPSRVYTSVAGGAAGSFLLEFAWPRLIVDDMAPGFKIGHFIKDLRLALDLAETADVAAPTTAVVARLYERLDASGGGGKGTQALVEAFKGVASDQQPYHVSGSSDS